MNLSETEKGRRYIITDVCAHPDLKYRFYDLGIVEGAEIQRLRSSPLGDPVAYYVKGTAIAIRDRDAKSIEVIPI